MYKTYVEWVLSERVSQKYKYDYVSSMNQNSSKQN